MKNDVLETTLGAVVILIAVSFFGYTYVRTDSGPSSGYELTARFSRVDGIAPGSDVRMSGIKVGAVSSQYLDPTTYMAVVNLVIRDDVELPDDSSVKITSEGLLGGNYLNLEPGGSDDMLADGDEILFTQGSIDLMSLIGQAIFAVGNDSDEEN